MPPKSPPALLLRWASAEDKAATFAKAEAAKLSVNDYILVSIGCTPLDTFAGGYRVWGRSPVRKLCITCAEESPGVNPLRAVVTISGKHFCGPHADALVPDWRERKAKARKK